MTIERSEHRSSWRDAWRGFRNRTIADPGFQRWAATFPLTRPIARRRAQSLFDLSAGFVYSQVALACVRLGVLPLLTPPRSVQSLAEQIDLSPQATERLLKACVALRLAERCADGRFALGDQGAALLGAPGVAAMIEHHALLYADLVDPVALLRGPGGGGRLAGYWPYAEGHGGAVDGHSGGAYSSLMAASQAMVAAQVLDAWPIARHRRLLDVGGGNGAFIRAVAARAPDLELTLFDLPPVATEAGSRLTAEGLSVGVTGGDFFRDPLPRGADIISLIRILHDHDDGPALDLLRAVHDALPPDGSLILAEPMSGTRGAETVGDAYFGFYLLAMGSGRPRTPHEISDMLREAGFRTTRRVSTAMPMVAQLIVATA